MRNPIDHRRALLLIPGLLLIACTEQATAPDGTRVAQQMAHVFDGWGALVSVAPGGANSVNTAAMEGCPAESPDGNTLYFASNRDGSIDIWFTRRADRHAPWGPPEKVPAPVSVDTYNDFCPSPLPGGGLLFVSTRPGGCGGSDIYRTRRHPVQGWEEPEHLGCEVNSGGAEFSPVFVDAGGGMLFFSSDRGVPGADRIYVSTRRPDGTWRAPTEVAELNADGASTARPRVSADGRVMVFDSNRAGGLGGADIWASSRASLGEPWSTPVNLGEAINSPAAETRAWLSADGQRLYVGSTRAGGQGSTDLYVATRR